LEETGNGAAEAGEGNKDHHGVGKNAVAALGEKLEVEEKNRDLC
jgi:hypothetical protein